MIPFVPFLVELGQRLGLSLVCSAGLCLEFPVDLSLDAHPSPELASSRSAEPAVERSLGPALAPQIAPPPHRPRDPWVFRSVLDKKPRMVTFALSDEMWAAYDATTCTLYKAWKGGVHFDGAVYTTVHGPQPTSEGRPYTEGVDGPGWEIFVGDKVVEAKARWRGYVFHDGRCTMNYEFELPDGRWVGVLETPEFVHAEDLFDEAQRGNWALDAKQPGLMRSFLASDLPPDVKITLAVRTDNMVGKFCEVEERAETIETKSASGTPETHSYVHVVLTAANRGNNCVLFFPPIEDARPPDAKPLSQPAAKSGEKK